MSPFYFRPLVIRTVFSLERSPTPKFEDPVPESKILSQFQLSDPQRLERTSPGSDTSHIYRGGFAFHTNIPTPVTISPTNQTTWEHDGAIDSIPRPQSGPAIVKTLAWPDDKIKAVQNYLRKAIQSDLDISKSFSKQSENSVAEICRKADKEFPELQVYADRWATKALLTGLHKTLYTKYTKSQTIQSRSTSESSSGDSTLSQKRKKRVRFGDDETEGDRTAITPPVPKRVRLT